MTVTIEIGPELVKVLNFFAAGVVAFAVARFVGRWRS